MATNKDYQLEDLLIILPTWHLIHSLSFCGNCDPWCFVYHEYTRHIFTQFFPHQQDVTKD